MGFKIILSAKAQKAFSLIEMLLTILIIGFIIGFSSQFFVRKDKKVRSVFNDFARLNSRLINLSHLRSQRYRLVFKLSLKAKDQYWVEKQSQFTKTEQEEPSSASEFKIDESFYSKPQFLPSLVDIVKIETQSLSQEEGEVFIYYNASALAQETKIYFLRPDNQGKWVLHLDPASKQLRILK